MDIFPTSKHSFQPTWQDFQSIGAHALAILVLAVSTFVLFGWIAGMPIFTRVADDYPSMVFNTALFFALLSLGLLCDRHIVFGFCSQITGAIVFVLSGATLLQYWVDTSFGIDYWFWSDSSVDALSMRPSAATCWTFMLLSGLMMLGSVLRRHSHKLMILIILVGAITPTTAIIIYLYDYSDLEKVSAFSTMAIHTSLSFIALYAVIAMGVGRYSVQVSGLNNAPGFRQFRRLILPTLLIPLGIGAVLHQSVKLGYLTESFGLAVMASSFCLIVVVALLWNSRREDEWFEQINSEVDRRLGVQAQLAMMLDATCNGVLFIRSDGTIKLANHGAAELFGRSIAELESVHARDLVPVADRQNFDHHFQRFTHAKSRKHYKHQPFRIHARNAAGDEFPVLASVGYHEELQNEGFSVLLLNGEMIERQMEQLRHKVRTDHLTLVGNRSSFDARMDELNAYGSRSGQSVALIMVDIDHFKIVNDRFGHAAGDAVLSEFARQVEDSLRYSDSLYRYGGEEFVVVAIGASLPHVRMLAERIRMRIERYPFQYKTKRIHITCSLGVAVCLPEEGLDHCLERADNSLFVAKNTGRNRVVVNERHDMN